MEKTIKKRFLLGVSWTFIHNIIVRGLGLVFTILLARILSPDEYGLIGMLSIFIALSQVFVESGITEALIQKTDCSAEDYSTAFVFNVGISVLMYMILYMGAPLIADFYHSPELSLLTRVLSLNILIGAFTIVQKAQLTRKMDFRSLAIVSISGVVIGGVIGLILALNGWGVWSLVAQTLFGSFTCFIIYPFFSKWNPHFLCSWNSFRHLWKYGSKMVMTGILNVIIMNISAILIGRLYNRNQVGYFTRGQGFAELPASLFLSVLSSVSFPVLCEFQSDRNRQIEIYKRILYNSVMFIFPVIILVALLSKPLVIILLTEKWLPCVSIMQILLLGRMFMPIGATHTCLLRSIGDTTTYMKLYFIDGPLTILGIIIAAPLGVEAMAYAILITSIIMYIITSFVIGRIFGYGIMAQLYDWRRIFYSLALMVIGVLVVINVIDNAFLQILVGSLCGMIIYFLCCNFLNIIDKDLIFQINKLRTKNDGDASSNYSTSQIS